MENRTYSPPHNSGRCCYHCGQVGHIQRNCPIKYGRDTDPSFIPYSNHNNNSNSNSNPFWVPRSSSRQHRYQRRHNGTNLSPSPHSDSENSDITTTLSTASSNSTTDGVVRSSAREYSPERRANAAQPFEHLFQEVWRLLNQSGGEPDDVYELLGGMRKKSRAVDIDLLELHSTTSIVEVTTPTPITKNVIESVPLLQDSSSTDIICAICQSDYVDKEVVRKLRCRHSFHQECVDQWLQKSVCCPLCKHTAVPL